MISHAETMEGRLLAEANIRLAISNLSPNLHVGSVLILSYSSEKCRYRKVDMQARSSLSNGVAFTVQLTRCRQSVDSDRDRLRSGSRKQRARYASLYFTDSIIWIFCFSSAFAISPIGMPFCAARSARWAWMSAFKQIGRRSSAFGR